MGGRVSEIGHAAPDHEAAQGCRRKGDSDASQRCAGHEIIQHYSAAS